MKNRKGFTLTEIVATLVIIGVLLLIAIPTYSHFSKKFEKEYYEKKFSTIEKAATTYFQDNKIELPSDLLNSYSTDINTLVDNKYIDNEAIKKYKSNDKCTGWIVTVKKEDSYKNQLCMDCGNYKSYSSDEKSCDKAWITDENNNSTYDNINDSFIKPEVDTSDIYIYYDSDKNAIDKEINKSKLKYSYNLYKCDSNDDNCKKLDQVTQTINEYPINYQNLDLTKTSSNQEIKYKRDNSKRRVIVYRHNKPTITNKIIGNEIYLIDNKINLVIDNLSSFIHDDEDVKNDSLLLKYQYSTDGKNWIDIGSCEYDGGKEVKTKDVNNTNCSFDASSLSDFYLRVVGIKDGVEEYGEPSNKYTIKSAIEILRPASKEYCDPYLSYTGKTTSLVGLAGEGFNWINEKNEIKDRIYGKDAKEYTITAKLKDNYIWDNGSTENVSIKCTIPKKEITIAATNESYTYDGKTHTAKNNCRVTSNNGLADWHSLYCSCSGSGTLGGKKYDKEITSVSIKDKDNIDVTDNYIITKNKGYIEILLQTYSIFYNANGGENAPSKGQKEHDKDYILSDKVPSKEGYIFTKWNTKADGTGTSYKSKDIYKINDNLTLYAQWNPNKYDIIYDANGGENAPLKGQKEYGKDYILSDKVPTKNGYTFTEWNTKADGTGTSYKSKDVYKNNNNLTLYAQWSIKKYTVTYYNPSGSVYKKIENVSSHTIISDTLNFSNYYYVSDYDYNCSDCNFTGWTTQKNDSLKVKNGEYKSGNTIDNLTGDLDLYPCWDAYSVKIYAETVFYSVSSKGYNSIGHGYYANFYVSYNTRVDFYGTTTISEKKYDCSFDNTCAVYVKSDYERKLLLDDVKYSIWTITLDDGEGYGGSGKIYEKQDIGFYSDSNCYYPISSVSTPNWSNHNFLGYYDEYGNKIIDSYGNIQVGSSYFTNAKTIYAKWEEVQQSAVEGVLIATGGNNSNVYYEIPNVTSMEKSSKAVYYSVMVKKSDSSRISSITFNGDGISNQSCSKNNDTSFFSSNPQYLDYDRWYCTYNYPLQTTGEKNYTATIIYDSSKYIYSYYTIISYENAPVELTCPTYTLSGDNASERVYDPKTNSYKDRKWYYDKVYIKMDSWPSNVDHIVWYTNKPNDGSVVCSTDIEFYSGCYQKYGTSYDLDTVNNNGTGVSLSYINNLSNRIGIYKIFDSAGNSKECGVSLNVDMTPRVDLKYENSSTLIALKYKLGDNDWNYLKSSKIESKSQQIDSKGKKLWWAVYWSGDGSSADNPDYVVSGHLKAVEQYYGCAATDSNGDDNPIYTGSSTGEKNKLGWYCKRIKAATDQTRTYFRYNFRACIPRTGYCSKANVHSSEYYSQKIESDGAYSSSCEVYPSYNEQYDSSTQCD